MDEQEMARVERELRIKLPAEFRRVMAEQGHLLRGLKQSHCSAEGQYLSNGLIFDPNEFVRVNLAERELGGLRRVHGRWWGKYVLIHTPLGGSTYHALELGFGRGVLELAKEKAGAIVIEKEYSGYVWGLLDNYEPAKLFLASIAEDPADDLRRLVFADWLEENGEGPRAEFIRARVALDGKSPEFGDYADAVERLRACEYTPRSIELPGDFNFYPYDSKLEQWWGDGSDAMEGGLPSMGQTEYQEDAAAAAGRVVEYLPTLLATTIRGLELNHSLSAHAATIFAAPAAARLTRLEFDSRPPGEELCPVVAALASSPVAANLSRVEVNAGLANPATVAALVATPFARLTRFDIKEGQGPADGYRQLAAAPWLPRLERLTSPAPPGTFGPVVMPYLHTLGVWIPADGWLEAMARDAELPALRRLFIHGADLRGKVSVALAGMRCGDLVELWLRNSAFGPKAVATLLAAPWARRLEVLTFEVETIDPALEAAVEASPCAKTLRILTIK